MIITQVYTFFNFDIWVDGECTVWEQHIQFKHFLYNNSMEYFWKSKSLFVCICFQRIWKLILKKKLISQIWFWSIYIFFSTLKLLLDMLIYIDHEYLSSKFYSVSHIDSMMGRLEILNIFISYICPSHLKIEYSYLVQLIPCHVFFYPLFIFQIFVNLDNGKMGTR